MVNKLFVPVLIVAAAMFACAPFMILAAPYESTMGLVQKIFYFHVGCGMTMFVSAMVSGMAAPCSSSAGGRPPIAMPWPRRSWRASSA